MISADIVCAPIGNHLPWFRVGQEWSSRARGRPSSGESLDAVSIQDQSYTTEQLCARIVERHRDRIKVRKPALVVANLSRIVTAFLKLANRKGFHATSLRDLAQGSGLSMGALYNYFDSKESLLLMVLGEVSHTMSDMLETVPPEIAEDPLRHLRWVIANHIRLTENMQPWFVFAFMEAKAFPASARKTAVDSELLAEKVLEDIFTRGNVAGVFDVAEPQLTASLVKPLLQDWYVKRAKYRRRKIDLETYISHVIALVEAIALKR